MKKIETGEKTVEILTAAEFFDLYLKEIEEYEKLSKTVFENSKRLTALTDALDDEEVKEAGTLLMIYRMYMDDFLKRTSTLTADYLEAVKKAIEKKGSVSFVVGEA